MPGGTSNVKREMRNPSARRPIFLGRLPQAWGLAIFSQRQGRVIVQPRPTAWVMNQEAIPGLKGRYKSSVPDITLVVGDLMAFQKAPVFFLKCHLLMVPCLVFDVGNDGFCF